MSRENMDAFL